MAKSGILHTNSTFRGFIDHTTYIDQISRMVAFILLQAHSVLKLDNGNNYLLCKKGCKGVSLIGRDGGAEIFAFAETNKFYDVENEDKIKSVTNGGFSCCPEYNSVGVATKLESSGIRMDVIPDSFIDYLITEEKIY